MRSLVVSALLLISSMPSRSVAQPRLPIPIRGMPVEPTPAEREFSAGDTLLRRGDLPGATARFEAARRLDPRDARPVFYLGEVAFRQSRFTDADALFREAIRLRPAMAEAHAELGATLRALHRLPDAVTSLREATRLTPSLGEAHSTLGQCLEEQGDRTGAADAYRAAARHLRDDATAPLNLGLLLAGDGPAAGSPAQTEALRALREAVRRGDREPAVLAEAGVALRRLGDVQGAIRALDRARTLQTPPTSAVLGELAQAYAAAGRFDLAETRLTEALRSAPTDPGLHYLHGLVRASAGDRPGAVTAFRECLRLEPRGDRADRARARVSALGPGSPAPRR